MRLPCGAWDNENVYAMNRPFRKPLITSTTNRPRLQNCACHSSAEHARRARRIHSIN